MEIYLEPVLPAPRLLVFGVSPTAQALVRLGKGMGYTVFAIDPEAEPELFPDADRVLREAAALDLTLAPQGLRFAVVATLGERDEAAIREALSLSPAYLGVVASGRRFAQIRQTLLAGGLPAAILDAIRSPAGVRIGAQTSQEIAISILAEIVERHRAAQPAQATGAPRETPEAPSAGTDVIHEAIDPICGMTVTVATARHRAEHAGRTYYFCCGGCRERFLATPERYFTAGLPETAA